jgi:hypothetical protein
MAGSPLAGARGVACISAKVGRSSIANEVVSVVAVVDQFSAGFTEEVLVAVHVEVHTDHFGPPVIVLLKRTVAGDLQSTALARM